jgi:hypothetical protein
MDRIVDAKGWEPVVRPLQPMLGNESVHVINVLRNGNPNEENQSTIRRNK